MSGVVFTLNIFNNTDGAITFNGFTNGVDSPPTSDGNPPLMQYPLINAGTSPQGVVVACGGSYVPTSPYPPYYGATVYPDTEGQVSFNLPDASVLTVYWDCSNSGTNTFNTPTITSPTSYEVITNPNGSTLSLTIQPQS